MKKDDLILKYLSGKTNAGEQGRLHHLMLIDPDFKKRYEAIQASWEQESCAPNLISQRTEDWNQLVDKISSSQRTTTRPTVQLQTVKWIVRVAAVLLLGFASVQIWNARQTQITIRGTADNSLVHLLPDGSQVVLKKGSKLQYPKNFSSDFREVKLNGEGYFDVKGDPKQPFIVNTADAKVRVTGTSFRIQAPSKKEEIEVMVRAGKVLFYNSEELTDSSFRVDLRPGDIATYNLKLKQLYKTHNTNFQQLVWN